MPLHLKYEIPLSRALCRAADLNGLPVAVFTGEEEVTVSLDEFE